jgi:hypothetical protein
LKQIASSPESITQSSMSALELESRSMASLLR